MNLDDLQKLIQTGRVVLINSLVINDYSQHVTVEAAALPPAPPPVERLYPWNDDATGQRYAAECARRRWLNDRTDTVSW